MVRRASISELDSIMDIYAKAREFMRENGNPRQWANHPSRELIQGYVEDGYLYVVEKEDGVLGVFAFLPGPDEAYVRIDGAWLDDAPYWVIHAVASTFRSHGLFSIICDWVFQRVKNVRIDTSPDNKPMLRGFEKQGFTRCGIVHVAEDPELTLIAYQRHDR